MCQFHGDDPKLSMLDIDDLSMQVVHDMTVFVCPQQVQEFSCPVGAQGLEIADCQRYRLATGTQGGGINQLLCLGLVAKGIIGFAYFIVVPASDITSVFRELVHGVGYGDQFQNDAVDGSSKPFVGFVDPEETRMVSTFGGHFDFQDKCA
jgi:hypothetical protein